MDLPTGATVVTTFGLALAAVAAGLGLQIFIQATRAKGLVALTGAGIATFAVLALATPTLLVGHPAVFDWSRRGSHPGSRGQLAGTTHC